MVRGPDEGLKQMRNKYVAIARRLRRRQTPWELKLWRLLRSRNLENLKFRRQYPIGTYIVDFCCFDKKLIIELDGGDHNKKEQRINDEIRDKYLINSGFKVLRIWNNELDINPAGVIERILNIID